MLTTQSKNSAIASCIQSYLKRDIHFSPEFTELFKVKTYAKGAAYIRSDDLWDSFAVVVKGVFRLYYIDEQGKEHTKGIFCENTLLAPCAPSAIAHPINFNIDSFEKTEVLSANYKQVREYLESSDWGASLLISMLERLLDEKVEREYIWLTLDAESRYLRFLAKNSTLAKRLPLYIIANYLGMSDVTLSRIRKKLNFLT
ncbi:MAG: Crp/Fnr family transcriptional regulator [Colwellia sp.]